MQILLNANPNTDGGHLMAEHLERVVKDALGRLGERITRVEAHLADVNGAAKTGTDDVHCTLEARLVGLDAVIVKAHAGSAHQAIDAAVRKLRRAVVATLEKHGSHHPRGATPGGDDDVA